MRFSFGKTPFIAVFFILLAFGNLQNLHAAEPNSLFLDSDRLYALSETDPEALLERATSELPMLEEPRARFNAVIFSAHALRSLGRFEEGIAKATEALEMAREANDRMARMRAKHDLAVLHLLTGNPQESAALVDLGLTLGRLEENSRKTGMLLNVKGNVAVRAGDIAAAQRYFRQSAEIGKSTGDRRTHLTAIMNEAATYFRTGEHGRMITAYEAVLEVIDGQDLPVERAIVYSNMGEGYLALGMYDQAEELIRKSLELELQIGDPVNIAITYFNLGQVAAARREWTQAEEHYMDALSIQREIGDRWNSAHTLQQWARDLIDRQNYEEAADKAGEALLLSQRLRSASLLRDLYALLATIDRAKGDTELALYRESLSAFHAGKHDSTLPFPGVRPPDPPQVRQDPPGGLIGPLNSNGWFLIVEFALILLLCLLIVLLAISNHRLRRQLQEIDNHNPPVY